MREGAQQSSRPARNNTMTMWDSRDENAKERVSLPPFREGLKRLPSPQTGEPRY